MSPVADSHFVKMPEGAIVKDRAFQIQKSSPRPLPSCSISPVFLKRVTTSEYIPKLLCRLGCI